MPKEPEKSVVIAKDRSRRPGNGFVSCTCKLIVDDLAVKEVAAGQILLFGCGNRIRKIGRWDCLNVAKLGRVTSERLEQKEVPGESQSGQIGIAQ